MFSKSFSHNKIVNKNFPIDEEIEINKIVIKDSFYEKGGEVFYC